MIDKKLMALFLLLLISVSTSVTLLIKLEKSESIYYDKYVYRANNSCSMRFPDYIEEGADKGVNGLYSHPDYFCVWTRDRTAQEIGATAFHEMAHFYNYRFAEHFRKDFNRTEVAQEEINIWVGGVR